MFAHGLGIVGESMTFESRSGLHKAAVTSQDAVSLAMPDPRALLLNSGILVRGERLVLHRINTGVPHAVVEVDDLDAFPVIEVGRAVREHRDFMPEGTNADFVRVLDDHTIRLRTYERGVEDETLACGTGAVAAALVTAALGRTAPPVTVRTRGESALVVGFYMSDLGFCDVSLAGDARTVYEGTLEQSDG
jgi:diaminopimelate epimerase